jgi:hypothetical protein
MLATHTTAVRSLFAMSATVDVCSRDALFQPAIPFDKIFKDRKILDRVPTEIMVIAGRYIHEH